jgi:Flp pilus assembly protein TadD
MGAAWSLIGLLPVIGLVQVGAQSHAERYAYLPMVGALIALTWWVADLARERGLPRAAIGPVAVVSLLLLAILSRGELHHWRSEVSLFSRAREVHERSGVHTRHAMILYYQLGTALRASGRNQEAASSYRRALACDADDPRPHNNLGSSLAALGRYDEAAIHFGNALAVDPRHGSSLFNLAIHEHQRGDPKKARELYARFLEAATPDTGARNNAIRALLELGAPEQAAAAALRAPSLDAESLSLAAEGLRQLGRDAHARTALEQAQALAPGDRVLRNNLAYLLATASDRAVHDAERALTIMRELAAEAPLDAAERDTLRRAREAATRATRGR